MQQEEEVAFGIATTILIHPREYRGFERSSEAPVPPNKEQPREREREIISRKHTIVKSLRSIKDVVPSGEKDKEAHSGWK